ncbi:hypothetical protein [Ralstonia pseudosolanacearum]|uniref:hypothetical protein n=1 Tax=Ralstonia pseudosolanacearum TaxID=1310165 RepID=UPI003CED3481
MFLNPNREACVDGFARRTTPIPEAPVVPSQPEKPAEVHAESHQANDAIAPWDIPEPNRAEVPAQSAKPLKVEKPNADFFL